MLAKGSSLSPTLEPNPDFISAATAKAGGREAAIVLYGPGRADKSENAVYVSKEMFVSLSNSFVGEVSDLCHSVRGCHRKPGRSKQPGCTLLTSTHPHELTSAHDNHAWKQDVVLQAAEALRDAGYTAVSQLDGGYRCASVVSTLLATLLCEQPRLCACLRAVLLKVTTAAMNLLSQCVFIILHLLAGLGTWHIGLTAGGAPRATSGTPLAASLNGGRPAIRTEAC